MHLLKLIYTQCKLNIKDLGIISNLLIAPILTVVALDILFQVMPINLTSFAVINQDVGELSNEMLEELNIEIIFVDRLDKGLALLEDRDVNGVIEITEEFSQMLKSGDVPKVTVHQRETRNLNVYKIGMQNFMQEYAKVNLFSDQGIVFESKDVELDFVQADSNSFFGPMTDQAPITMTVWMLFLNAGRIARELNGLKSSKVLERLKTTSQKNYMITLNFCISHFIVQNILLAINVAIFKLIFNYELGNLINLAGAYFLMNLFTISLGIAVARIIKNGVIIENALLVIGLAFLGLGNVGLNTSIIEVSDFIGAIAQFSPFYWAYNIILNGNLFPGVWVLSLMCFVLLTAGTLKRDQFLQE